MTEKSTLVIMTVGRSSLVRTLRSACAGDRSRLSEVLLLDNSPGGLPIAEVEDAVGGVPYRLLPGAGRPGGRNTLLAEAGTDLVCCTDDDCVPDPLWINNLTEYLSENPSVAAAFGRVEPVSRSDAQIREVPIEGVGLVAWGEAASSTELLFCPAVSAPSWRPGIATGPPSVPWACVGSSNNLGLRRSLMPPGRPVFLPNLGPHSPAGSGEDTELGYALMAAGRPVAYVADALVLHDSWLTAAQADAKRRGYFRGNTEALAHHATRGDRRAAELLVAYWAHFCEVNGFEDARAVLEWAYGRPLRG